MSNLDYKQFTERHRPHIQPPDSIIFVTYRLAGSIPKATVREYKARKVWLDDQGARIRSELRKNNSPEAKRWLEQVENFKREWFVKFEAIMHGANTGPMWMKDERVADVVAAGLQRLDANAYRLDAYSVMSNHVHAVFKPFLSANEESAILCCRALGSFGSTKALTMWFVKEHFTARSDTYLIILLKQVWSTIGENGAGTTVVLN